MAQLVKHPSLDFSSGHELTVHGINLCIGLYVNGAEPALDSLSPSVSAFPLLMLSLSK